jgi:MYXO-CTERM domain-containing protein
MDATFDDAGIDPLPASGDVIGIFAAVGVLADFNALELSGAWELRVLDTRTWPDEGLDLVEWRFTGSHVPEPGSGTLLGLGLLGLAMLSGRRHEPRSRRSA